MSLQIPTTAADLLQLGQRMLAGLTQFAQLLGITQITPLAFEAKLNAFKTADDNFNAARSAEQTASAKSKAAMAELDAWLATVKGVLLSIFGSGYTVEWAQAGFVNNTTAIPQRAPDRVALSGRLVAFFTRNPSFEVATTKVTAAQGTALLAAVNTAGEELITSTRALKDLGTTWDTAFTALSDEEWTLVKLLQATLNDDDTRWLAFGLQMPATRSTPGQPSGVTAHEDENGNIVVTCDPVPVADRYRLRTMVLGVETEYSLAASSREPIMSFASAQPGQTVQMIVQAVNGKLQGVASAPITFTVLLPAAKSDAVATAKPAATVLDEVVITSNGNGHRDGKRLPALS